MQTGNPFARLPSPFLIYVHSRAPMSFLILPAHWPQVIDAIWFPTWSDETSTRTASRKRVFRPVETSPPLRFGDFFALPFPFVT